MTTIHKNAVSESVAAQNTFTEVLPLSKNDRYTVSVSGTFAATVTVQRSFDDGVTWLDVKTYTAAAEEDGICAEAMEMRIGVATGNYTSGTAVCRLGK